MFKWWWRSSKGYTGGLKVSVDGSRNVLKVSVVVLVVLWTNSMLAVVGVLFN